MMRLLSILTLCSFSFLFSGCGSAKKPSVAAESTTTPVAAHNCALTPEAGLCKAAFHRAFFDPTSQSCKSFVWGGCGGSVPFETLDQCRAQCVVNP